MTDPSTLPVGTMVAEKYRIERHLDKGGMGFVLQGRHVLLDQKVAIKVVHAHLAHDPEIVERFLREARTSAKLQSQHAARVTDVGRLPDGPPYMVMEFLEGTDLGKLLAKRGTLGVDETLDYVLQACDALWEAHCQGIYHRDLKPANLFLTSDRNGTPQIKLLDFGISKVSDAPVPLTEIGSTLGTPPYMSPEQTVQARDVDARTDIWSLGCVLYRLLTGMFPFRSTDTRSVAQAVLFDAPELPTKLRPDLPAEVEAIILRCLEKERERRFPNVLELVAALKAVNPVATTPPSREPTPVPPPVPAPLPTPLLVAPPSPVDRSPAAARWRLNAAIGGVIGSALLIAAALYGGHETDPPDPDGGLGVGGSNRVSSQASDAASGTSSSGTHSTASSASLTSSSTSTSTSASTSTSTSSGSSSGTGPPPRRKRCDPAQDAYCRP